MSDGEAPVTYCLCKKKYKPDQFMIQCDACKDWFHGDCVELKESQAAEIEIYHCPLCIDRHGPLSLKPRRSLSRTAKLSKSASKRIRTGTPAFIKELKSKTFPNANEVIMKVGGRQLTFEFLEKKGFNCPILVDKSDGLGLTVPPKSFSVSDVEFYVGSMTELSVIDVHEQEDFKMLMREWAEYYTKPSKRERCLNVISFEFSNTRLSEVVVAPEVVRRLSWVQNVWPKTLPENCPYDKPDVNKYCLMGVKDAFTDFHIDFGGTSVWYHILRGEKIFYLIEPTPSNLLLYENWLSSSKQNQVFFGDQVEKCYRLVVKQGQTLFIASGWIHAVLTPVDSLVMGGNFLHSLSAGMQLQVYEMEQRVNTLDKYMFPNYETTCWYATKALSDQISDCLEDGEKVPGYVLDASNELLYHLKGWSQKKHYLKNRHQQIPPSIQCRKLLKELGKQLKIAENPFPSRNRHERSPSSSPSPPPSPVKSRKQSPTKKTLKGRSAAKRKQKASLGKEGMEGEEDAENEEKPLQNSRSPGKAEIAVVTVKKEDTEKLHSPIRLHIPKNFSIQHQPSLLDGTADKISSSGLKLKLSTSLFDQVLPGEHSVPKKEEPQVKSVTKAVTELSPYTGLMKLKLSLPTKQNKGASLKKQNVSTSDNKKKLTGFSIADILRANSGDVKQELPSTSPPAVQKKKQPTHSAALGHGKNQSPSAVAAAGAGKNVAAGQAVPELSELKIDLSKKKRRKAAGGDSDDEDAMPLCYRDDEYIYPTLDDGVDEGKKDNSWNPKAPLKLLPCKSKRPKREGKTKQSMEKGLAAAAKQLANKSPPKNPSKKKTKVVVPTASPNYLEASFAMPSGSKDFPWPVPEQNLPEPPETCDPLIMQESQPDSHDMKKVKRLKKGMATSKQRLGKLLGLHRMRVPTQ